MENQVQQLRDKGLLAALLNSTLSPAMKRQVTDEMEAGLEGVFYIGSEQLFAGDEEV